MGYTEIKQNISELSERERRELVAYIVRITDRIDDTENFVKWNDIKAEFQET